MIKAVPFGAAFLVLLAMKAAGYHAFVTFTRSTSMFLPRWARLQ